MTDSLNQLQAIVGKETEMWTLMPKIKCPSCRKRGQIHVTLDAALVVKYLCLSCKQGPFEVNNEPKNRQLG